jgi:hypothetical protein
MLAGVPQAGLAIPNVSGLEFNQATGLAEIVQRVGLAGHDK